MADELKDHRNDFEDACLRRLAELVPAGCRATHVSSCRRDNHYDSVQFGQARRSQRS